VWVYLREHTKRPVLIILTRWALKLDHDVQHKLRVHAQPTPHSLIFKWSKSLTARSKLVFEKLTNLQVSGLNSSLTCSQEADSGYILTSPFYPQLATSPSGPRPPFCRGFTITLRHTRLGRTPPDERSARLRDLYLTTHNTHKGETSMSPAAFKPAIPASERPQTHALDSASTDKSLTDYILDNFLIILPFTPKFSYSLFPLGFQTKPFRLLMMSHMLAKCPKLRNAV
jgi:hypothetical protein